MLNTAYICLSDLHLGEEDSLLTGEDSVLACLAECLAEVLRHNSPGAPRPVLILAGDLLELALCPQQQALAAFEQFLRAILPAGSELFGEIIYLPGNHDHHMWQAARETQYLRHLECLAPGDPLDAPWDTTKVMMDMAGEDRLVCGAATAIARRLPHLGARGFEVLAAYPNFGLQRSGRAVVFHHGHFIESAYRLFSTVATLFFPGQCAPRDIYTLERENSSWIDFFWSTMGGCGRIGADVETIYEASADPKKLEQLVDTLAASIAKNYAVPKWAPRFLREWVLKAVLRELAGQVSNGLERRDPSSDTLLSQDSAAGLRWYGQEMLRGQFRQEGVAWPASLAFVLGHTHKPFAEFREGMEVLNTGGWTVDAPRPQSLHGAAAVLVAEDLSTAALRFYNEDRFEVRVEEAVAAGQEHSLYYEDLRRVVNPEAQPWKAFTQTARAQWERRAAEFAKRTGL